MRIFVDRGKILRYNTKVAAGFRRLRSADVAELADALDLGSSVHDVQVQVLSSA